ncbi:MAG: Glycerate kinase [Chitinophagaceae bacterium]|nr:Glycerate kinase [Chitinophagaceae bacterium]
MKVLVVPDSMKDALSAREAALIMKDAILEVYPDAEVECCPFSDGGEGLIDVLSYAGLGQRIAAPVFDPLKRTVDAELLKLEDGVFFIEMAQASGLERLSVEERNPLYTSTYGTGQLISCAIRQGAHKIFLGMGGSATHDLGCGMAMALGAKFYDVDNREIDPIGKNLGKIVRVDLSELNKISAVHFFGMSDVTNPLLGEQGAAHVYAVQKGADELAINVLEEGSDHLSGVLNGLNETNLANIPGAGAAGGLGFGLVTFLHGKVLNAVEVLSELFELPQKIKESNLVITLEGRTDRQTLKGKAPYYVGKLAGESRKTRIHFTGSWDSSLSKEFAEVFDAVVPIQDQPMNTKDSIRRVRELLKESVLRTFRLIKIGQLF